MNETMNELILETSLISLESSINIFEEMVREYDKMMTIEAYCIEGLADATKFFQEAESVIDHATGKHTNDNMFWKIVMFVPRLITGMIKSAGNALTHSSNLDTDYKKASAKLANMSEEQLAEWVDTTNTISEGNIAFDPKQKVFCLLKPFRHIRNAIYICTGLPKVLISIKGMISKGDHEYKTILKDLIAVLTHKKDLDEMSLNVTLDGFKKLLDDANAASKAMYGLTDEIGMMLSKQIQKDFKNGGDPSQKIAAQEALLKINEGAKWSLLMTRFIKAGTGIFGGLAKHIASKFGRDVSNSFNGDMLNAKEELAKQKAELKRLKAEEDALRKSKQNELQNQDKLMKINKQIEATKASIQKMETKTADAKADYDQTHQDIEDVNAAYEANPSEDTAVRPKKKLFRPFGFRSSYKSAK